MPTSDTSLGVINSMSEEMLESLKDSNGKIPSLANQLIMTDDEADVSNVNTLSATVLYDKNSSDASINRGYTSGIASSTSWTMNIDGYDFIQIYYQMYFGAAYNTGGNCNVLELSVDTTKSWNIAHENPFYYDNGTIVSTQFAIDYRYNRSNYTNTVYFFNNGGEATSVSAYHIYKIVGFKKSNLGVIAGSGNYPVGATYMSPESTSPASLFGGTWTQLSSITVVNDTKIHVTAETETGYVRTRTTSSNGKANTTQNLQTYQWDNYNGNGVIAGATFDFSNLYGYPSSTTTLYIWKRIA